MRHFFLPAIIGLILFSSPSIHSQQCKGSFFLPQNSFDIGSFKINNSNDFYFTLVKEAPGGYLHAYAKYDSAARHIWTDTISGFNLNTGQMSFDSKDNLLVVGHHSSLVVKNVSLIRHPQDASGNVDGFVGKIAKDGNPIWFKTLAGKNNQIASMVVSDKSDNIYVAGSISDFIELDGKRFFTLDPTPYRDMPYLFLVKFSPDGKYLWHYIHPTISIPYSLNIDSKGSVYILEGGRALLKFDSNGNKVFERSVLGAESHFVINSKDELLIECTTTVDYEYKYSYLLKMSSAGEAISKINIGNVNNSVILDMKTDANDNVFLCGEVRQPFSISNSTLLNKGYFLIKLSKDGSLLWSVNPPNYQASNFYSMVIKSDIFVSGDYSITNQSFPSFGHFKNHPDSTLGRGSFISRFGDKVNKPSITRSLPFLICDGDSIEFASEMRKNSEYFWNIDGELSDKKSNRIVVSNEYMSRAFSPIISLAVIDKSENCISQTVDLSVYPRLTISDNVLCSNSVGLLAKTDSTSYSYSWRMNGNLIVDQHKSNMLITKGGIYSVIVSDNSLNCKVESNEVEVFESQIPLPVLSKDKDSYCEGNSAIIESNWIPNGNLMNWLFNGKFIGLESVKGISTKTEGEFSVLVEDIHGCNMTSNSVAIKFNSLPSIEVKQIADTLKAPSGLKGYQWFKNETALAGATNYFYVPVNSGKYKLMGTSLTGCSNFSNPINFIITSIADSSDISFFLYPNPSNGTINFGDNLKIDFAEIIDVTGSTRLSSEVSQNKLDVSDLSEGFYLIRASSMEKTYCKKFYLTK
jgi:hypothetical protein